MSQCANAFLAFRKSKQAGVGEDLLNYLGKNEWAQGALAGAGVGGITGALSDQKGSFLKHVLGGATLGGGLGGAYQLGKGYFEHQQPQNPTAFQEGGKNFTGPLQGQVEKDDLADPEGTPPAFLARDSGADNAPAHQIFSLKDPSPEQAAEKKEVDIIKRLNLQHSPGFQGNDTP